LKQYLLSVYAPDDLVFERPVLEAFVQRLDALIEEMKAVDAWVFSSGMQPPRPSTGSEPWPATSAPDPHSRP
jgi:hypothetical protein